MTGIYEITGAVLALWLVACWLTGGVDQTRLLDAVKHVNGFFVYEAETGKVEAWRRLSPDNPRGDCEDYALSVIGQYSGRSFLWNVCNMFKFRLWYVKDPRGRGHLIGVCKHGAFDNHKMKLTPVERYKSEGYRFVFPWPFPLIPIKMLIGRLK